MGGIEIVLLAAIVASCMIFAYHEFWKLFINRSDEEDSEV